MDNATRAARLAQIFGWEINQSPGEVIGYRTTGRDVFFVNILFDDCGGLLPWLLRELNLREYGVSLDNMTVDGWDAEIRMGADRWWSNSADPLIALVDATIAAHAERRAT